MLPIVICEDNNAQREEIRSHIKDIISKEDFPFCIGLCTGNVQEVLDYIENKVTESSIYLLDVDLKNDLNGIQLAEIIRKNDIHGHIIFITTHAEMSYMTFKYKVGAIDFIIKDNSTSVKQRLSECLSYINEMQTSKNSNVNYLTLKQDDRIINIFINDVLFIESSTNSHKIIIHEEHRQLEVYGTLNEFGTNLSKDFYRCHRAYLVNRKKIKEIDKKARIIYMVNGEQCLISFRYLGGLLK